MDAGYEAPPDVAREKTPPGTLKFATNLHQIPELDFLPKFPGRAGIKKYARKGFSALTLDDKDLLATIVNIEDPNREDIDYYLIRRLVAMGFTFRAVYEFWCRKECKLHRKDDEPYVKHLYGKALARLEAWVAMPDDIQKKPAMVETPKHLEAALKALAFMTATKDSHLLESFIKEDKFLFRDRAMDQIIYVHPPSLHVAYARYCAEYGIAPCLRWELLHALRRMPARYQPWLVGRTSTARCWDGKKKTWEVAILNRIYLVQHGIWPEQQVDFDPRDGRKVHTDLALRKKSFQPIDKKNSAG